MVSLDAPNISIFLSLLRSGMYGTPIPETQLPDSINWKFIAELAKKHTVTGLIIDSIQHLPQRLQPDPTLTDKFNRFALNLIRSNLLLDKAAIRLVTFLRSHGINGVLLKGQGIARTYYRMPQLRQCGDIDFYIGKKQYKPAIKLCREHLLHVKDAGDVNEQHFHFEIDGVTIELHRLASKVYTPVKGQRFQRWVVDQLEHSADRRTLTLGDTDITLPSYDFDAIYIFYHAWRHFMTGGIGLRQLCDWSLVLSTHYDDIDIPALKENIRRFGLTQGWKLFASIAVNHLGVPADKMPLYDPSYTPRAEKILVEILTNGNFGFYSEAYARTPMLGYGLWHGMGKLRNIIGYYFSLFPIIPVEATFLFLHRLTYGTVEYTGRTIRKFKKDHSSTHSAH